MSRESSGRLAPAGLRLAADPGLQMLDDGQVLLGGAPLRLLRLRPGGAHKVTEWADGHPVGTATGERALARRLLDAGLFHPRPAPGGPPPDRVTIVVPVRDRPAALRRCLDALRATAPASPVIVVDDGSADRLAAVRAATTAGARYVRRAHPGGPAAARNTGLAAATTPYVAFVDSDCAPAPEWLSRLLPHFDDPAVAAVAPRITGLPAAGKVRGTLARYEQTRSSLDMGPGESIVRPGARVPYVPSATVIIRRAALADATQVARPRSVGAAFDEVMPVGEDVDLIWRLAAAGWRVRYEPRATVAHEHRTRARAWLARRADYGTSAAPLATRHPGVLPAVSMSGWSAAAWALAVAGYPAAGLALTAAVTVRLAERLGPLTDRPFPLAVRLAGLGTLGAGRLLGSAVTRTRRRRRPPPTGADGRRGLGPGGGRLGGGVAAGPRRRHPAAAGPGAVRRGPAVRRRRVQRGRVAGLRTAPDRAPAAPAAVVALEPRRRRRTGITEYSIAVITEIAGRNYFHFPGREFLREDCRPLPGNPRITR